MMFFQIFLFVEYIFSIWIKLIWRPNPETEVFLWAYSSLWASKYKRSSACFWFSGGQREHRLYKGRGYRKACTSSLQTSYLCLSAHQKLAAHSQNIPFPKGCVPAGHASRGLCPLCVRVWEGMFLLHATPSCWRSLPPPSPNNLNTFPWRRISFCLSPLRSDQTHPRRLLSLCENIPFCFSFLSSLFLLSASFGQHVLCLSDSKHTSWSAVQNNLNK